MKATKKLIKALRTTADNIEANITPPFTPEVEWDWNEPCCCNVGLLLKELGATQEQFDKAKIYGFWYREIERLKNKNVYALGTKRVTGLKDIVNEVMLPAGLELDDIKLIETCAGVGFDEDNVEYNQKLGLIVVNWMRDKANVLEHKLNQTEQQSTQESVSVKLSQ